MNDTQDLKEVVITNQNAKEASAGGPGGSTLDVADGGNTNQQAAGGNGENTAGGNTETDATETATCENCDVTDTRITEGTMLTYTYTDMSATKYAMITQMITRRSVLSFKLFFLLQVKHSFLCFNLIPQFFFRW